MVKMMVIASYSDCAIDNKVLYYSDTKKIQCTVDPVPCVGWRWRPQATGKEAAEVNRIPEIPEKGAAVFNLYCFKHIR